MVIDAMKVRDTPQGRRLLTTMNRSLTLVRVIRFLRLYTPTILILGLTRSALYLLLSYFSRAYDALDIIPRLWLYCTLTNAETYKESEWKPELSAPEFFALVMVSRKKPNAVYSKKQHIAGIRVIKLISNLVHVLYVVQQRRVAMQMHSKSQPSAIHTPGFVAPRIRLGFLARELHLRNAHFEDKEIKMLRTLFSGAVHAELIARLGFGLEDVLLVRQAFLERMVPPRYESYLDRVSFLGDKGAAADLMLFMQAMESQHDDDERMTAIAKPAKMGSFSLEELKAATGIDPDTLNEILLRMSIDLDGGEGKLTDDFLNGENPLVTRPFIRTAAGDGQIRWVLVQPSWIIFGIRRVVGIRLAQVVWLDVKTGFSADDSGVPGTVW
ncbi:hypothetical protein FCN77_23125 [Arthrobacter sp. 24S4-2]|uniref:hypothetical protein n=1 Tax=Arthrobacter sp. 24S4-2 TaxID=2575374 RepID=UPI0010C774BD|nr:hypothetical protein [Arthrobacter sp. 24S4-2]QCP00075.1 hypothetical protein FCN77_23125 [Arthrobacter sp. 24S4-2]